MFVLDFDPVSAVFRLDYGTVASSFEFVVFHIIVI
jgi:hypothetical protein